MSPAAGAFAGLVLDWQAAHGRKNLPWQDSAEPYRVWLSEVMLQQTQVATVKSYFLRFVERLPDVASLANASLDEVLGLWSGLGYYSRARNLHQCAIEIMQKWGGQFPRTAAELETLPGIGRSTAAAIASLCFGERVAILDANVRRVLARVWGFESDLATAAGQQALWEAAERVLPRRDLSHTMPRYTQGVMDLGATVCLPRAPLCLLCPLGQVCKARRSGDPEAFPIISRKLRRSSHSIWLLWARSRDGAVWLRRRPMPGVWAGLYCMPWFDSRDQLLACIPARDRAALTELPAFKHVLTHQDLHLHLVQVELSNTWREGVQGESAEGGWFGADQWPALGLPAPVRRVLTQG
ncbi:MAG: A/G-specific adenine glycosylase [Burkholderiaceae bacterium]